MSDVSVIIPFRGSACRYRQASLPYIRTHLKRVFPGAEVILADDPDTEKFNRGRAINAGVLKSKGDVLVFSDGDLWIPGFALQEAAELVRTDLSVSYVVPYSKIIWLRERWTELVLSAHVPIENRPSYNDILLEWGQTSVGGCNVVNRERFFDFGGFDPRFRGWGYEDSAFEVMGSTIGGAPYVRLQAEGRHLFHPECRSKADAAALAAGVALCKRYVDSRGDVEACVKLRDEIYGSEGVAYHIVEDKL